MTQDLIDANRPEGASGASPSASAMGLPLVLAAAIHGYEFVRNLPEAGPSTAAIMLTWSLVPLAVAYGLFLLGKGKQRAIGYAWACFLGSAFMHYLAFYGESGHWGGLGLLAMPLLNLVLVGPFGWLLGWSMEATAPPGSDSAA
jgi:hypothetical protein